MCNSCDAWFPVEELDEIARPPVPSSASTVERFLKGPIIRGQGWVPWFKNKHGVVVNGESRMWLTGGSGAVVKLFVLNNTKSGPWPRFDNETLLNHEPFGEVWFGLRSAIRSCKECIVKVSVGWRCTRCPALL